MLYFPVFYYMHVYSLPNIFYSYYMINVPTFLLYVVAICELGITCHTL